MADVEFIDLSEEIHRDERGFSLFPWQGRVREAGEVVRTGHLVSVQPGHSRGHHYHPGQEEWLFTFHGVGLLTWEVAGQIQERMISGGGTMIRISPGVAHALTNPGPEILYLLAWRQPAGTGPTEPETVPRPLSFGDFSA
ncbi:MAG: cupin domain-containing protein [Deltaproteobacteria bacterium]|nr:cupin domain-containing protein [Deltaproteobacteria bacterium]